MKRWVRYTGITAGVLAAVLFGATWLAVSVVSSSVLRRFRAAQVSIARTDIAGIMGALDDWATGHDGTYPESLEQLVTPDENGQSYLYMEEVPVDPWGREYRYEPAPDRRTYRLWTLGADGAPGGEGEAADLVSQGLTTGRKR